jgi:hypothetical protein
LELLDTAEWMRRELRAQLDNFDSTPRGFRLLERIHREGPLTLKDAADGMRRSRQDAPLLAESLEERGWVAWQVETLPRPR